ncbi:MAG: aldo/keto reductase [Bacteroidales bacterium]|nr:aldo/keto reductase [Bacteroidales bacterium]
MEYRRFGKTGEIISTITLGGMRFIHGWDDPREEIPRDTLDQCTELVKLAFESGINHIETAYGYKKSEHSYGIVLNDILNIPRESYYLMTKGDPATAGDTRKLVESQLKALKTDYFDFYGWHGMNNLNRYMEACKSNGPVVELLKLKEEGVIKHVGFSTHAPLHVIIKAIETDLFEFVNLHYYYFFQRNFAAIALAETKDMGVFIISPNDKGGQLFNAPPKIKDAVTPSTPIQWNARFCLRLPSVHTLSFGMTEAAHFKEMKGIFPTSIPLSQSDRQIKHKLDGFELEDPFTCYDGYDLQFDPSGINIPEVLRFRKLLKCYDMKTYGQYRYNMFEEDDHWFPGKYPTPERIEMIDTSKVPDNIPIKQLISETHKELYKPKKNIKINTRAKK